MTHPIIERNCEASIDEDLRSNGFAPIRLWDQRFLDADAAIQRLRTLIDNGRGKDDILRQVLAIIDRVQWIVDSDTVDLIEAVLSAVARRHDAPKHHRLSIVAGVETVLGNEAGEVRFEAFEGTKA